jgi:hypothetical protein
LYITSVTNGSCAVTCHLGVGPAGVPKGVHYTAGEIGDVWHWKAVRTDPMQAHAGEPGYMDDQHFRTPDPLPATQQQRYTGGYHPDPKTAGGYRPNFEKLAPAKPLSETSVRPLMLPTVTRLRPPPGRGGCMKRRAFRIPSGPILTRWAPCYRAFCWRLFKGTGPTYGPGAPGITGSGPWKQAGCWIPGAHSMWPCSLGSPCISPLPPSTTPRYGTPNTCSRYAWCCSHKARQCRCGSHLRGAWRRRCPLAAVGIGQGRPLMAALRERCGGLARG